MGTSSRNKVVDRGTRKEAVRTNEPQTVLSLAASDPGELWTFEKHFDEIRGLLEANPASARRLMAFAVFLATGIRRPKKGKMSPIPVRGGVAVHDGQIGLLDSMGTLFEPFNWPSMTEDQLHNWVMRRYSDLGYIEDCYILRLSEDVIIFTSGRTTSGVNPREEKDIPTEKDPPSLTTQFSEDGAPTTRAGRRDRRFRKTPLPSPEKARWADENRSKKQINVRLPEALIEELDRRADETGKTRTDLIELAIRRSLDPT